MEQSQIFMIDLDFTVDDIKDKASYIARAKAEAQLCYNTPSTRRGRTWPNLYQSYKQGHAAEYYLIENFGFKCAGEKYKDLINTNGELVEVKTRTSEDAIQDTRRTLNKQKHTYKKIPDTLYFWLVDYTNEQNPAYNFYAKYKWKDGRFVITSKTNL
jgi:Holliday junction resolvase-like predicted endonuclease